MQPNKKQELFFKIQIEIKKQIKQEEIISLRTNSGNTQQTERNNIGLVKHVLDDMHIHYEEASSQQSKDFRNVGNIGLNIEIKKTDSCMIVFNDTCPCDDIYYIIFYTGTNYKKKTNIPPQILFLHGSEFLKDTEPWLPLFIQKLEELKDEFARGENKKNLGGILEVYPRPTFKANISSFIV